MASIKSPAILVIFLSNVYITYGATKGTKACAAEFATSIGGAPPAKTIARAVSVWDISLWIVKEGWVSAFFERYATPVYLTATTLYPEGTLTLTIVIAAPYR
eukprot:XP_001705069.1 Hypothetical protein GL50803_39515 [Giardia lamblia ATCC 50803]